MLREAIRRGVAKTKAEALRIAVLKLDESYHLLSKFVPEEEASAEELAEHDKIIAEMRSGKSKNWREVMGA
ncbi:MAG: hypothetical protein AB1626_04650 [Candidatus Micrarchaeota archaeon]